MDRRHRVSILVVMLIGSAIGLGILYATAPDAGTVAASNTEGTYPGATLIAVQAYGWFGNFNGDVFIVNQEGERIWEYQPPNAAVFDAEHLDNGNIQVAYGEEVPDPECPEQWRETRQDHCVLNHVQEIDRETNEVVWEYTWYDRFTYFHEVHDADRLANGETVIIDMGQHRVFTVNNAGNVTWEWDAIQHLDEGSEFWNTHVVGTSRENHQYTGPNQDWTHMNDVDQLDNGNYLLSIRNFDVLIEVDPTTNDIVTVIGEPGNHSIMYEQHDPHLIEGSNTVLISDSENDRVVEYDLDTMREVWRYDGPSETDRLTWPRNADRLPNGNTLIADSRGFRVLEINETGAVVWGHDLTKERGIVYDADRLGPNNSLDEEPPNVPSGNNLAGTEYGGAVRHELSSLGSWLGFVLPIWFGPLAVGISLIGVTAALGLCLEGYRYLSN